MVLRNPPIQEVTSIETGLFPQVWIRWLTDIRDAVQRDNSSNITNVSGDITLDIDNTSVFCDATSGAITVTMPNVSDFLGFKFYIKKTDTSANDVTIDGDGANIEAASTRLLSGSGRPSVELQSDGTEWWII